MCQFFANHWQAQQAALFSGLGFACAWLGQIPQSKDAKQKYDERRKHAPNTASELKN